MFTPIHRKGTGARVWLGWQLCDGEKGAEWGRGLRKGGRGRKGEKEMGGREGEVGVYIINYDFITCSQFLGDLLFRGALMNNKKRGQREEKAKKEGVIDEASADTATSWLAPVLLHGQEYQGDVLFVKIATEGNNL